jgi:hypothetical protein
MVGGSSWTLGARATPAPGPEEERRELEVVVLVVVVVVVVRGARAAALVGAGAGGGEDGDGRRRGRGPPHVSLYVDGEREIEMGREWMCELEEWPFCVVCRKDALWAMKRKRGRERCRDGWSCLLWPQLAQR